MNIRSKKSFETDLGYNSFNYTIPEEDLRIVNNYLSEKKKISDGAYRNNKCRILNALNYLQKPLEAISMLDMKNYFEDDIDKRDIKAISKNSYRSYLKSFFDYVTAFFIDKNRDFMNPVPNSNIYKFTKRAKDIEKRGKEENKKFSKKELLSLLRKAKKIKYRDFILFGLLTMCGMRVNEALTIKIKDINFSGRYLETGFERGARKTTLITGKSLIFFFTSTFKSYLKKYVNYLDNRFWLFPGQGKTHLNSSSVRTRVKRHYNNKFLKFHTFRKSLITHRLNNGCPLYISEILTNHVPSSTQGRSYVKKSIKEKRQDFDKYFPYKAFEFF